MHIIMCTLSLKETISFEMCVFTFA